MKIQKRSVSFGRELIRQHLMKILLAITVSLIAVSAFAEDLIAMKKSANEKLDKQISIL